MGVGVKLTFAQLEALLGGLYQQLVTEKLSVAEYMNEWDKLVSFSGWTWPEFTVEIDKRWESRVTPSHLPRC